MGFQFEEHRLGLWDLSWDLKKTISWEMGLGTPPSRPSESCFPLAYVPLGFSSGNIEGLRETKLTVSLGACHYM